MSSATHHHYPGRAPGRPGVRPKARRGTRTTLGINRFRRFGTVYVQIFVPQGTGTVTIRDLSDDIAGGLENVPASFGVRIQDVDINELGSDGAYFQVNISADFTYDRQAT